MVTMRHVTQNIVKNTIANIWIGRWIVLAIFLISICGFGSLYIFNATYVAKGTLLVQKAQNSTIQEISAGLGRMPSDEVSPFSKDLYTEKFLLYLNSRDFFLEASDALLRDPRINDIRLFLKITDEEMKADARYLPSESVESKENTLINTLASALSSMAKIMKSGNLGLEITAKAGNPEIAIIIVENLMKSASQFIMSRELQELNAAKDYLQQNMKSIETGLEDVFAEQVDEIRKNPKIQQASKLVLLEKVSRASGQIEALRSEIRGNELVLVELARQNTSEKKQLMDGEAYISTRFKSSGDSMREHIEALAKKRQLYLNSGMNADAAFIRKLDDEISVASSELKKMPPSTPVITGPVMADVPIPIQIREIERQNFLLEQKSKSLQKMLGEIFAEGIEFATYEQRKENLLKRAEIRYSLYSDLSKQLFKVEMYRISFQNKIIEIEKPSYRTISRKPTQFSTVILAFLSAFGLSYLFLLQKDISDPVIKSVDDVRDLGLRILGAVPPIRFRFKIGSKTPDFMIDHFIDNSDSIVFKNIRSKFIKQHTDSERSSSVCVVTSSRPSEGKSFFCLNISASLANAGYSVVVIDTDSRKQGLSALQETQHNTGLMEYLKGSAELSEVLRTTSGRGVKMISAGKFSHDTSELLMDPKMKELLQSMRKQFDFVIMDTAPVLAVNDSINLLYDADIVSVIVRVAETRFNDLVRTIEGIAEAGKTPQLILNMSGNLNAYYYRKSGSASQREGDRNQNQSGNDLDSDSAA